MAVIFNSEHTSDQGRDYKVEIIDTDGGTLIDTFLVNSDGFRLEDTGKGRDLHQRIISKVCSFTIQVQNQDQEDFIVDLATADEGRYIVKCYRETDVIFIGPLVVDNVQIDNAPKPYDFKLEAVDGLKLLKNEVFFEPDLTNPEPYAFKSLLEWLEVGFSKLATFGEYGAGDVFLEICTNWWSKEHIEEGQDSGDLFAKTYLKPRTFAVINDEDEKFISAYDAIDAIVRGFNCRLFYDEGKYVIEQFDTRVSDATPTRIQYNSSFSSLGTDSTDLDIDVDQTNNHHLAGGIINILPPLRKVVVNQKIQKNYNYLKDYSWNDSDGGPYVVGTIDETDEDVFLRLYYVVNNYVAGSYTGSSQVNAILKIYLNVGSDILDGNSQSAEWVDAATNPNAAFEMNMFEISNYSNPISKKFVDIVTPAIQNFGDVEFEVEVVYRSYAGFPAPPVDSTSLPTGITSHTWSLSNEFLIPSNELSETRNIEHTASQDAGSAELTESILFGDGATFAMPHLLAIKDASNKYIRTTGWKVGTGAGSYVQHGALLAQTILAQRKKALRVYNGTIFFKTDLLTINNRVSYDGYNLLFNKGTIRTNFDEIQIQGIEISQDNTGINDEVTEIGGEQPEVPFSEGDNTGGQGNDPNDPSSGIVGLITNEVLYAGATGVTSIDIVEADQDYFVTNDRVIIKDRVTGVEQEFTLSAPIENTDTTISVDSSSIDFQFAQFSPIFLAPQLANRRPLYQLYENTTGSPVTSIVITAFTLPNPAELSATEISKILRVYRMTSKMIYNVGYTIDFANNEIDFMWEVQDGEYVEVELL